MLNLCGGLGADRGIHIGTPKPWTKDSNSQTVPTNESSQHIHADNGSTVSGGGGDENEKQRSKNDNGETCTQQPQNGDAKDITLEERLDLAYRIKSDMDKQKLALKETAYAALIRLLAKSNRLDEALDLLNEAEKVQQCKARLRLYSSLLIALCDNGNLGQAIDIWHRLHSRGIPLSEREYCGLLRGASLCREGHVFARVLADLAEDVLVPCRATVGAIQGWFEGNCAREHEPSDHAKQDKPALPQLPPSDASPILRADTANAAWSFDRPCAIDADKGILRGGCLGGHCLQPVPLSDEAWDQLRQWNESLVLDGAVNGTSRLKFQGGGKGPRRRLDVNRRAYWVRFQEFLQKRGYSKGTGSSSPGQKVVVIDGANVGYYQCNYEDAPRHVDYNKIKWIVDHFAKQQQQQGYRVLLCMHERHFKNSMMPKWARGIVNSWDEAQILYRTPGGMNDDWFWMHAALSCGRGTKVVTNDEMRDHHFQMLAPRSFARWKERHQIHFTFGGYKPDGSQRTVLLTHPAIYSRRIQRVANGFVVPLPKLGDQHRYLDGTHVADDGEPKEETYLALRPKKDDEQTGLE